MNTGLQRILKVYKFCFPLFPQYHLRKFGTRPNIACYAMVNAVYKSVTVHGMVGTIQKTESIPQHLLSFILKTLNFIFINKLFSYHFYLNLYFFANLLSTKYFQFRKFTNVFQYFLNIKILTISRTGTLEILHKLKSSSFPSNLSLSSSLLNFALLILNNISLYIVFAGY